MSNNKETAQPISFQQYPILEPVVSKSNLGICRGDHPALKYLEYGGLGLGELSFSTFLPHSRLDSGS